MEDPVWTRCFQKPWYKKAIVEIKMFNITVFELRLSMVVKP